MTGKLHELLAAETDLAGRARSTLSKTVDSFGRPENYLGQSRTYQPLIDGGDSFPPENKDLPRRATEDLDRLLSTFGRWIDASLQKEVTNQQTSASVKIDGREILSNLPAPALLNLENKLAELRKVLQAIPVNDTATRWTFDDQIDAYISAPRITFRTEKTMKHSVAYLHTEHHPAQVETYNADERVGEWTTIIQSGMMQAADKRRLLDRFDELLLAVKRARQRANDIEVETVQVAQIIISHLRG